MKKLNEYFLNGVESGSIEGLVKEYRTPGSTNKKKEEAAPVDLQDVKGKEADSYGNAKVDWAVEEPTDNDASGDIDLNSPDNTDSLQDLIDKFDAEEDFFIIGQAGWGKTSTIKSLCKKYKRIPVTVYLDKAVASDLGGIPIPTKGKDDKAVQEMAMPAWAKIMLDNPDKKFLLFFDEMNQAAPDVMNALMPIVLEHEICNVKFKNFFVGAAGNFESENKAVSELSGPLKSRFKPLITWEAGTSGAWKQVFKYLHKQWDNKLGKNLVTLFEKNAGLFDNPREIEQKIFKFIEKLKGAEGATERNKPEKYLRRLQNLAKDDLTRTQEAELTKLAEAIFGFIKGDTGEKKEAEASSRKTKEMVPQNVIDFLRRGIERGYIEQEGRKYGISRENILDIEEFDYPREMLERVVNKIEDDGAKFKYEKNAEWQKLGYEDPNAD